MYSRTRRAVTGTIVTAALFLSACQQGSSPDPGPEMGNATPAASPAAQDPDGEIIAVDAAITDLAQVGDTLAYRTGDALTIGSVAELADDSATTVDIDASCGDLSAGSSEFVLACGDTVRVIPADNPADESTWELEQPATTAALAGDTLVTGNDTAAEVVIYREGEDPQTIMVEDPTDQMITVPRTDDTESVVRINRELTIIQNVDLENDRQGGTLRVGVGVGQMAPGEDGLVIVADTLAPQIAIYGYDDVVRLQQTAPTEDSPWGVAWDPAAKLAWVASTAENEAIGYTIENGVPQEVRRVSTIADPQNMRVTSDGTLVIASASGDGLQLIAPSE